MVRWLVPGGRAFFTVVDRLAYQEEYAGKHVGLEERVRRVIAASILVRFMSSRLASKFLFSCDYSSLYKTRDEMIGIFESCSVPIQYEILQFRDAKHPKLGCKIIKSPG